MGYGIKGTIGIKKQTSWTAGSIPPSDFMYGKEISLSINRDQFDYINIHSGFHEPDRYFGTVGTMVDIRVPGFPSAMGFLMNNTFGVQSMQTLVAGELWKNTFTFPATSGYTGTDVDSRTLVQPYTYVLGFDVTSAVYILGAAVNRFEVGFGINQELSVNANILAYSTVVISGWNGTFPSSPSEPFAFDQSSISIGGNGNDLLESIEIVIENNFETVWGLRPVGTLPIKIRRNGPITVRMSGVINIENISEYLDFINRTERAISISLFRANSFSLVCELPRFEYSSFPVSNTERGRIRVGFDGIAHHDNVSGYSIKVDLTNTSSWY